MVRLLRAPGGDVSQPDELGMTPLVYAVFLEGDSGVAVLAELLDAEEKADVNTIGPSGLCALDEAARLGRSAAHAIEGQSTETVQELLEAGVDVMPGVLFRDDWTPMMCAAKVGDV
ncbi:hypothetical protein MFIFM68171_02532 [Madurella fahalii]|uniref:Uncharacterized protein n=1 Tax=Madurella fahalii TaxID=1157608 RepID=A0ABQ0G3I2_9PEZI